MEKENRIELKISGRRALFSDPVNRMGGEKFSYQIPTYQALKGILESVYWKPTFIWYIDAMRVMHPICTESQGVRPLVYSGGNTLSIYTYLVDVEYQVAAHFEWNENRPDLSHDRNENKHYFMAKRFLERGGRRDIFLGTRECQGYVEPCKFDEGEGFYDGYGSLSFGLMFHGFTYPDEAENEEEKGKLTARFWNPVMHNGRVDFIKPGDCTIRRVLSEGTIKEFSENRHNFTGLSEFGSDEFGMDKRSL